MRIIIIVLFLFILHIPAFSAETMNQKAFNKLSKQEQLTVLRNMRKQEISQINSQIKDVKSSIKSVENTKNMPLNRSQAKILKLNQDLTALSVRKADIEKMYEQKIKFIKKQP